jgi:NADH-quinone oxidoreductase subunit K
MLLNQIFTNTILFFISLGGLVYNRQNILLLLMCIELVLLSVNLNFLTFSVYLDDFYGQIFFLFILTIAAAESAIGLAILILYYRLKGNININQTSVLKN